MSRKIIFFLLSLLLSSAVSIAQLSGPLSGVLGPGSYTVIDTISVESGDSLEILPGTELMFDPDCEFYIHGFLSAIGTETDEIIFMRNVAGDAWSGIDFTNTADDNSVLEYCFITGSGDLGIKCVWANPTIRNCSIVQNDGYQGGGIFLDSSNPEITNCDIIDCGCPLNGAGIYMINGSAPLIENCYFTDNYCLSGGGIYMNGSNPTILNCRLDNNSAAGTGGAISMVSLSEPFIKGCEITNNFTFGSPGGAFNIASDANPTVENCTFSGNHSNSSSHAAGIYVNNANITMNNCILEGTEGFGALEFYNGSTGSVTNCDFFNNENSHFLGVPPAGLGEIITININGDSCDIYSNIFLDPLYYAAAGDSAYYLSADSPCIDAGNPNSPFDPDNSIADIGAHYFPQLIYPVMVTLTPLNPPIQIPLNGGSFEFNVQVSNDDSIAHTFDFWAQIELPGTGSVETMNALDYLLPAGQSVDRVQFQMVPPIAPAGIYILKAYIGEYPWDIYSTDNFTFQKNGFDNPGFTFKTDDWICVGEEFDVSLNSGQIAGDFALLSAYPNPFNPTTTISFDLPVTSFVSLEIFDITGRSVGALHATPGNAMPKNQWMPAGSHSITFDGSNLTSGVYFVRLNAGDFKQTRKMVLVK